MISNTKYSSKSNDVQPDFLDFQGKFTIAPIIDESYNFAFIEKTFYFTRLWAYSNIFLFV